MRFSLAAVWHLELCVKLFVLHHWFLLFIYDSLLPSAPEPQPGQISFCRKKLGIPFRRSRTLTRNKCEEVFIALTSSRTWKQNQIDGVVDPAINTCYKTQGSTLLGNQVNIDDECNVPQPHRRNCFALAWTTGLRHTWCVLLDSGNMVLVCKLDNRLVVWRGPVLTVIFSCHLISESFRAAAVVSPKLIRCSL